MINDPALHPEEEKAPVKVAKENSEDADFGLTFTVPRICLNLKTRKKAISSKIDVNSSEWELKMYLEQIAFELEQKSDELCMKANVSQLKVQDNA